VTNAFRVKLQYNEAESISSTVEDELTYWKSASSAVFVEIVDFLRV